MCAYNPETCVHHQDYVRKFVTPRFYDTSTKLLNADYYCMINPALGRSLTKYLRFECNATERKRFKLLFVTLYREVKNFDRTTDNRTINLLNPTYHMVKLYGRTLLKDKYFYPITTVLLTKKYQKFQDVFQTVLNSFNIYYEANFFGASLVKTSFQNMPPVLVTKNKNSVADKIKREQFDKYYLRSKEKYHTFKKKTKPVKKNSGRRKRKGSKRLYTGNSRTQYRSDFCNSDLHERIKNRPYSAPSHIYQHRQLSENDSLSPSMQKKKVRRPYVYDEMMKFSSNIPTTKDTFAKTQVEKKRSSGLTFGDQNINKNVLEAHHTASFGAIIPPPKRSFFIKMKKEKKIKRDHLQSSKILSLGEMFGKSTYKNDFIPQKMLYVRNGEMILDQRERNYGKKTKPFACLVEDGSHSKLFLTKKNEEMATIVDMNRDFDTEWKEVLNGKTKLI